ncbi:MAG: carbon monoxide dehydrogenase subunit G [Devosiaceae bacterium]|nr:carbon monoxide dehydrogenase subunit G [Devosiaceae bacterium]
MQFSGKYLIKAPRDEVWRALNNADILKETIPGCKKIAWVSDNELELEIMINLGLINPKFAGGLELKNVTAAQKYTLLGYGKGSILGHAHGEADIELSDFEGGTILSFNAKGGGSNALMKLGKKIIGKSAQKIIDRFFERFAKAMGAEIKTL